MDPVATPALLGALAKLSAGLAAAPVSSALGRITLARRVARRVRKESLRKGISIPKRAVRSWLKSEEVEALLSEGQGAALDGLTDSLARLIEEPLRGDLGAASSVLLVILREYLAALPASRSVAVSTQMTSAAIADSNQEIKRHITEEFGRRERLVEPDATAQQLREDLCQIHPWRAADAESILQVWPRFGQFVHEIAVATNPAVVLEQWADQDLDAFAAAPPSALAWLGFVALDYGSSRAGSRFLRDAIASGASPSNYLWARVALAALSDGQSIDLVTEFCERSAPEHPLANGVREIARSNFREADAVLERWSPDSSFDLMIRAVLRAAAAAGLEEFNRAIAILEDASRDENASACQLRVAEMLIGRAFTRWSDSRFSDFGAARVFALRARDARRRWRGDSVAAVLVATQAAAFANDLELAWSLTTELPAGEATEREASDPRVRRERALLAAMTGRIVDAIAISGQIEDAFVSASVRAYEALGQNDAVLARRHFLLAFDAASDDVARLQTLHALAELGGDLPDADDLALRHPEAVAQIRSLHEVLSAGDDKLALLRARASTSPQFALYLAEYLDSTGDELGGAEALLEGANRWNMPLMYKMAAERFFRTGAYARAEAAAVEAYTTGGAAWTGALDALAIRFEALEQLGRQSESVAVARVMVGLDPTHEGARWALVGVLVRQGDLKEAWNALAHDGSPISPRSSVEAEIWVSLAALHDRSPYFLSRSLTELRRWADEPELVGQFLMQIHLGLRERDDDELDADELSELQSVTAEYAESNPESTSFRRYKIADDGDPLETLTAVLKDREQDPSVEEVRQQVRDGQIPLGMLTRIGDGLYAEASTMRAAGRVYACDVEGDATTIERRAVGLRVVLDTTAAATLAILDPSLTDRLIGTFSSVTTTDAAFRDALATQQSFAMRSTLSVAWDRESERSVVHEIDEELLEQLRAHARGLVDVMERTSRRVWTHPSHFTVVDADWTWFSAADVAAADDVALWTDDRVLRVLMAAENRAAFGTVDLLRYLGSIGSIEVDLQRAVEADLVRRYYVDLGFDPAVMTLAAQMEGWNAGGAAASLQRVATWTDPGATAAFWLEACAQVAATNPDELRRWVANATVGLIKICGTDEEAASNLQVAMKQLLSQSWMNSDALPFVVDGIRLGVTEVGRSVDDPLRPVVSELYRALSRRLGWSAAAQYVVLLSRSLSDGDRTVVAEIVLTAQP